MHHQQCITKRHLQSPFYIKVGWKKSQKPAIVIIMCFVLCLKSIHLEQLATRFHFRMFLMDSGPFVIAGGVLDHKVWSGTGRLVCECSGISHWETSYVVVNDSPTHQFKSCHSWKERKSKRKKCDAWLHSHLGQPQVFYFPPQVFFSDSTCSEHVQNFWSLFPFFPADDSADLNLSFHSLNKPGFNVSNHHVDPPAQPQIIHWKWLQV